MLNAEALMQNLRRRSQTVGGAAAVADNFVLRRVIFFMVHAHHHGDVIVFARRGEDHALGAAFGDVNFGFGFFGEEPGGLNDQFDANAAPWYCTRIALRENADGVAIHFQLAFGGFDIGREGALQ